MDDQYENVNVADFDVVQSTQFVDDLSRGVRIPSLLVFFSCTTLMQGHLAM